MKPSPCATALEVYHPGTGFFNLLPQLISLLCAWRRDLTRHGHVASNRALGPRHGGGLKTQEAVSKNRFFFTYGTKRVF
jgi:hypothetical protein